jgi:hypothetical protein
METIMTVATIVAGLFLRVMLAGILETIFGTDAFIRAKAIHIMGAIAFIAVLCGVRNESVDLGIYLGFFAFDILGTLVVIKKIKLLKETKAAKATTTKTKKERVKAIDDMAKARLKKNRNA